LFFPLLLTWKSVLQIRHMGHKHDKKIGLKKRLQDSEVKITESILRWKHRKEGSPLPDKEILEQQSRRVTDQANTIVTKRLKNIWSHIKDEYKKTQDKEDR